eukprot:Rhum_TRINITY_DN2699_c0_g1::Rhum_TRINITY_DN2699_c0_g1_i1::g.7783::m.7783
MVLRGASGSRSHASRASSSSVSSASAASSVAVAALLCLTLHTPGACGMDWNLGAALDEYRLDMKYDDFRVLPYRRYGFRGRAGLQCAKNFDHAMNTGDEVAGGGLCGRATGYLKVTAGADTNANDLTLLVTAYTREAEEKLEGALVEGSRSVRAGRDNICKLFSPVQDGKAGDNILSHSSVVQELLDGGDLIVHSATFAGNSSSYLSFSDDLEHSDLWIFSVALCSAKKNGAVPLGHGDQAVGDLRMMAPTGHLAVRYYSLMEFYLVNFGLLLALLVAWTAFGIYKRSAFGGIHFALTVMLVVTTLGQFLYYLLYNYWNDTGDVRDRELYFVMAFEAFRKTAWCFLLCLLANGYRSIHPTLAESNIHIIGMLTVAYLCISLLSLSSDPRDSPTGWSRLIGAWQAAAYLAVYVYVFIVLNRTIEWLQQNGQNTKRAMFAKLFNILVGYIMCLIAALMVILVFFSTLLTRDTRESFWQFNWMFSAYWHVLFEGALVALLIVWRPSESSVQLLYSIELGDTDDAPVPNVASPADDGDMFSGLDVEDGIVDTTAESTVADRVPAPTLVICDDDDGLDAMNEPSQAAQEVSANPLQAFAPPEPAPKEKAKAD